MAQANKIHTLGANNNAGRVELSGEEAEHLRLRPSPEVLEELRRLEESAALGAHRARNILVGTTL